MKRRKLHRSYFTIIELLVSMGIFAVLSLVLFKIFDQVQNIYTISMARIEVYEKDDFILNLISRDLRNACNTLNLERSFYFPRTGSIKNDPEATRLFAFAASTKYRPSPNSISRVNEVTYFFDVERGRLYYRLISDACREGTVNKVYTKLTPPADVYYNFLSSKFKDDGNPFVEIPDGNVTSMRNQIWAPDREENPVYDSTESPEGRFALLAKGVYNFKVSCYNWRSKTHRAIKWSRSAMRYVDYLATTFPAASVAGSPLMTCFDPKNLADGLFPLPDVMYIELSVLPDNVWIDVLALREAGHTAEAEAMANRSVHVFRRFVSNTCTPLRSEKDDLSSVEIPTEF